MPGKRKIIKDVVHYICTFCSIKHGGVWPKGHQATVFMDTCDCCGKTETLASVADWNWPKGVPKQFSLAAGRD